MKSSTTRKFRELFAALPENVRQLARKQYLVWRSNPQHPSLHFKKIGSLWSVRINLEFRALGIEDGGTLYWFWIGNHKEYDRLIG